MLSDPQKRHIYEQYGEEGLKEGFCGAGGGGGGGPGFHPRAAEDIFAELFGAFNGMGGGRGRGGPGAGFGGAGGGVPDLADLFGGGGGGFGGGGMPFGGELLIPASTLVHAPLACFHHPYIRYFPESG